MEAINLTKDWFLRKVVDYDSNPDEWIFLGNKPCLVEFYTDWSEEAEQMRPYLDELADEYKEEIHIYKVNLSKEEDIGIAFDIQTIPTLLFCPMHELPQKAEGVFDKAVLKQGIEEILLGK